MFTECLRILGERHAGKPDMPTLGAASSLGRTKVPEPIYCFNLVLASMTDILPKYHTICNYYVAALG